MSRKVTTIGDQLYSPEGSPDDFQRDLERDAENRASRRGFTRAQLDAAMKQLLAIGEAIREARRIPSGHLYAIVMGAMPIESYEKIVGILERAGAVRREGDELVSLLEPLAEAR